MQPTAGVIAVSGVWLTSLLPYLLFGPIAGALADRLDRRINMVVGDVARAVLYLSIPLNLALGVANKLTWLYVAQFLACVEALEKYPFCNRRITSQVHDSFLEAYGAGPSEQAILRVLKMKALLGMFAQGRTGKESALRKKVMWATVMKRFIHQAAQRSLVPAA